MLSISLTYHIIMNRTARSRIREYRGRIRYFNQFGVNFTNSSPLRVSEVFDDYLSSSRRAYNPCHHVKMLKPYSGLLRVERGANTVKVYCDPDFNTLDASSCFTRIFNTALDTLNVQLDFSKNNSFELLNLIGELDEFLSLFTIKFWKTLSYGAFNWGLLPLYSDIVSLYNSLDDIYNNGILDAIDRFGKRKSSRFSISQQGDLIESPGYTYSFKGVLILHGVHSVSIPDSPLTALGALVDELGVHPDLRTVWDLIPLSFILDYFLPVGDILESFHPRGWFRPTFLFQGCASLKGELKISSPSTRSSTLDEYKLTSIYSCYARREKVTNDFSFHDLGLPNDYKFGLSLRQLFNLGYLGKDVLKDIL